ncbi:arylamine n-acetyltransferase 1 [Moniliophthora roreri MCA 2997]|uniref:Tpa: arylamine n-acetyltransferase 1 n=1 Tax=Moniliophthora roreri (strain MCA 2997) TaxID=1381753 RepID=V2YF63_MONRO|nr:arylamine n-acetyltransferase 1 [Moniliophthora roreri MCA 2997]
MSPLSSPTDGTLAGGSFIKRTTSVYSKDQVVHWLKRIGFPRTIEAEIREERFPTTLENLELLSRLHLVTFPFENLDMHYSPNHIMDVSPEGLYERFIVDHKKRRGSYCYGKSGLLLEMLRGLGYRVYAGQGRVNGAASADEPPRYTPLVHMVLFVQPLPEKNTTYLVDVGFGGGGPVRPLLLSDAEDNFVMGGTSTERHRLRRGEHPNSTLEKPSVHYWRMEVQHTQSQASQAKAPWKVLYTFLETEFFQLDFESASYFVSTHPNGSPFLREIICVKYHFVDDGEELGYLTLYRDQLKQHTGAVTQEVKKVTTEKDRIKAIKALFEMEFDEAVAIASIKGRQAALAQ